jgi:hypothetical protein
MNQQTRAIELLLSGFQKLGKSVSNGPPWPTLNMRRLSSLPLELQLVGQNLYNRTPEDSNRR